MRWEHWRYFVAVARAGSVVGAARRLGVSHATVIRNVGQLEESLNLRLFDHVRSGYRLTAEGEALLPGAAAMEEQAEALQRQASGRSPAPEGLLKLVVADTSLFDPMPLLRRFRGRHPGIDLMAEEARDASRIAQLDADAAILVTNAPPEALVGRQLARLELAWFAAPGYLTGRSPGEAQPEQLEWITWNLGGSGEIDGEWHRAALRRLTRRPRVVMRADRHGDALTAVRAGIGAGLLCGRHAGDLVRLPLPEPRESLGVWLLTHPDLRRSGRLRALFDFVAEAGVER